jgi:hypothetical protein
MDPPEAVAVLTPERPRGRRGPLPYEPTEAQRQVISMLASVNISLPVMAALLKANGTSMSLPTLRRIFRDELRLGRELAVAKLAGRMFALAMSDKPAAFGACAFLLRTIGGPEWRAADPRRDEEVPGGDPDGNVHFYLPPNGRNEPEVIDESPTIEGEEVVAEDADAV